PNENGPNTEELISSIDYRFSDKQEDLISCDIVKGENYFEHDNADAAILVLEENLGFDQIFIDERTSGFDGFSLTGYPESKRKTDDKYDRHVIKSLISSNENLISLRLSVDHLGH